jgi:hypothetical protein
MGGAIQLGGRVWRSGGGCVKDRNSLRARVHPSSSGHIFKSFDHQKNPPLKP